MGWMAEAKRRAESSPLSQIGVLGLELDLRDDLQRRKASHDEEWWATWEKEHGSREQADGVAPPEFRPPWIIPEGPCLLGGRMGEPWEAFLRTMLQHASYGVRCRNVLRAVAIARAAQFKIPAEFVELRAGLYEVALDLMNRIVDEPPEETRRLVAAAVTACAGALFPTFETVWKEIQQDLPEPPESSGDR